MASIKITELNEKTKVGVNDLIPIVDITANETKKITRANLFGGAILKSKSNSTTATIKSINGYGRVYILATDLLTYIAFEGDGVNATIHDMIGTNQYSATTSGKIVTLTGLNNWDHYIFIGSDQISSIE